MNGQPNPDEAANDSPPLHPLLKWVDADQLPRTPNRPCTYLPGRLARERAFLAEALDGETYHALMDRGFRRSGQMFYAMDCEDCRLCVPLRVPVATFCATKSQRRVQRKNADLTVTARRPLFTDATFDLYCRYLRYQHPKVERDENAEQFRESLYAQVVDTIEITYSLGDQLLAVSLLDICTQSVSAVYHFYDPEHKDRGLGVFSVLAEIEWTATLGVPFYYLGYWVEGAKTMHYKANYGPHEVLRDGCWRPAPDRAP